MDPSSPPGPVSPAPPAALAALASAEGAIAVTGASGWLGRVALDELAALLGREAFARRVRGYASREREVAVAGVGRVALAPLAALEPAETLLHLAFVTRPHVPPPERDAFVAANLTITSRVLRAVGQGKVERVLLSSSGAARDPDLERNPYGALKALDELAFAEACRRAGATLVTARIFNLAGPHMTRASAYALGDLIEQVRRAEPVQIAARGDVVRSYAGAAEVVRIGLCALAGGRNETFDTAGEAPVEIGALAEAVRRVLGREDLPIRRKRDPAAPPNVYVGDGARFAALAAEHGVALPRLDELIAATAATLEP